MAPSTKVSLKLLKVKNRDKVLFVEAGKDFVDFLFSLLSLPIGTVNQLLDNKNKLGCLQILHQSIENLNDYYLQPNRSKDLLLNPKSFLSPSISPHARLLPLEEAPPPRAATTPPASNSTVLPTTCHKCSCNCNADSGGFVKGEVSYIVMDDLEVKPTSIMSSIALLKKFDAKKLESLEEKVVQVGMDEGLGLLKFALSSNSNVLTNVFLGKDSISTAPPALESFFAEFSDSDGR